MDDCGCEGRREWLLQRSPSFTHPIIENLDGVQIMHSVLSGIITGVVLYYLLRSHILPNPAGVT